MRWIALVLVFAVVAVGGGLLLWPRAHKQTKAKPASQLVLRAASGKSDVASMQNAKSVIQGMLHSSPRGLACSKKAVRLHWTQQQLLRCEMSTR